MGGKAIRRPGREAFVTYLLGRPTQWTKSLILPLAKKGDLKKCTNYRTISLISHPSKVLLKIINNRLKTKRYRLRRYWLRSKLGSGVGGALWNRL